MHQIDLLQAHLGDACARWVLRALALVWLGVYLVVGVAAASSVVGGYPANLAVAIAIGLMVVLVTAPLLAACTAALGMVSFDLLDRLTASR